MTNFDPRVVLDSMQPDNPYRVWYRATNSLGTVFITDDYADAVEWVNS